MNYNFIISSSQEGLTSTSKVNSVGWVNLDFGYVPVTAGGNSTEAYSVKVDANSCSDWWNSCDSCCYDSYEKIESAILNGSNTFFANDIYPNLVYGINSSQNIYGLWDCSLDQFRKMKIASAIDLQERGNYVEVIVDKKDTSFQRILKSYRIPFRIIDKLKNKFKSK